MKKFLPLVLIGSGLILILVIVFFVAKAMKGGSSPTGQEEANIPEIPASEWPVVSLTPTSNPKVIGSMGHWLDFKVQKINIVGAVTMDYELIYTTGAGIQQGVPGTVKLDGNDVDRPLLLGSESSGKYRYDAGVEQGTMTLRFRDASGKMIGKLMTDFHLQSETTTLTSIDGKFAYTLDKVATGVFFVTMKTFLQPEPSAYVVWQNGYGVFASDSKPHTGKLAQ